MLHEKIKKPLKKQLIEEFEYYNFVLTGPANDLINSIVNTVVEMLKNLDAEEVLDKDYFKDLKYLDDIVDVPSDTECYQIIRKAMKEDSYHFESITESCGMDMSADCCLLAEWQYNIYDSIVSFILEFIEENEE